MDSEQLQNRFEELYEKYDDFNKRQLNLSAFKTALETKRFTKSNRMLIPHLFSCFALTNYSQDLFEPEVGADNALEIIALVESEEKARKFQNDYDEDHYRYTVHWISACAYDNLAKHTAMQHGYNAPVVHGAVDDGIHVCRRTGKLECVDCFREYATDICIASGDYEMGEHYARECAVSQILKNSTDRRFIGYKQLVVFSVLQGRFTAAFDTIHAAIPILENYYDKTGGGIELAYLSELVCLLAGREAELPELLGAMGHSGNMPEIPLQEENPLLYHARIVNEAVRATCLEQFFEAESSLAGEERFLLGRQNLDLWFRTRVQRIANLLAARKAGKTLIVEVDPLAEELRRRASKSCQWSAIASLDAMLSEKVRLNPLGIPFPIDIGPYATEGILPSKSPLSLLLPLAEKPADVSDEKIVEESGEKTPFEQEAASWITLLNPLWEVAAAHADEQERTDEPTAFPLAAELERLEGEILEKIVQITPQTRTGPNGESITEEEFLEAMLPLPRMQTLADSERIRKTWVWIKSMVAAFPGRGRPLGALAYNGFNLRLRAESGGLDPDSLGLPGREELEQWVSKAFELEPGRSGIATIAGTIFRAHENNREAQRYFSRANQIDRLNEYAAVSLAELYEEADRPKDALATVELYVRAGGRHPGMLWQGMQIAFRNEMPQEFLLYFDAYMKNETCNPMLDAQRIWALITLNRFDETLVLLGQFDGQFEVPGKDRLFLRALCQAELGDATWVTTFKEAMNCEEQNALIGSFFDPCERLWKHVRELAGIEEAKRNFERFLFERGLVPDDYFGLDDSNGDGEEVLKGYYRCFLRQPLEKDVPVYAGWNEITGNRNYLATWFVLADDEEEAFRLALDMQSRCYPLPAEMSQCEQLDSYYAIRSQVVSQGRRFLPSNR